MAEPVVHAFNFTFSWCIRMFLSLVIALGWVGGLGYVVVTYEEPMWLRLLVAGLVLAFLVRSFVLPLARGLVRRATFDGSVLRVATLTKQRIIELEDITEVRLTTTQLLAGGGHATVCYRGGPTLLIPANSGEELIDLLEDARSAAWKPPPGR